MPTTNQTTNATFADTDIQHFQQNLNTTFSNADIQRFYDYLSEQLALAVKNEHGITLSSNPATLNQTIASFRKNEAIQQNFPAGIADILTPLHLDTFTSVYGSGWSGLKPQTVFKMFDHLTMDAGTAEFARCLTQYAYALHSHGDNVRANLFRYIEEMNKDMTPDDDNKVILNIDYIFNVTGRNYRISASELEETKDVLSGLNIQQIQHYIKPGFDAAILPLLAQDLKSEWSQQDYRPDEYFQYVELTDLEVKLKKHLQKHIANSTHADLVYHALVTQTDYTDQRISETEDRIEFIKLAIQNTDAGRYDNVTITDSNSLTLTLPTKPQVIVTTETPAIAATTTVPAGMFSSLSSSNLKILALVGAVASVIGVGLLAKSIANTFWGKSKGYAAVDAEKTSADELDFDIQEIVRVKQ
jgi:mRNA-degrading endonuclease HigB of HigAB toxin-antitoxin module